MTDAPVTFGVIPPEQWLQPEWINATRAQAVRKSMALSRVPLGGQRSYALERCAGRLNSCRQYPVR